MLLLSEHSTMRECEQEAPFSGVDLCDIGVTPPIPRGSHSTAVDWVREAHAVTPWSLGYLLGRRWWKRAESLCKMTGQQPLRRTA